MVENNMYLLYPLITRVTNIGYSGEHPHKDPFTKRPNSLTLNWLYRTSIYDSLIGEYKIDQTTKHSGILAWT